MSRNEASEEHAARMQAALDAADAINEATQKQPEDATVDGDRYGVTGGTVQGNVHFRFN